MHPDGDIVVTSTLTALALKGATPDFVIREKGDETVVLKQMPGKNRSGMKVHLNSFIRQTKANVACTRFLENCK